MTTLSRQSRDDVHSACPLCAHTEVDADATDSSHAHPPTTSQVESVTHFLASCPSVDSIRLRYDLCGRLREAIDQWLVTQRAAWAGAWKGSSPLTGPNDPRLLERSVEAERTNGVDAIAATMRAMEALCADRRTGVSVDETAPATVTALDPVSPVDVHRRWCEVLLGRRADPVTGTAWDATLLAATQRVTQNYLLLLWRARAARLGGVPTLLTGGRGLSIEPYQRMKSIGLRRVARSADDATRVESRGR